MFELMYLIKHISNIYFIKNALKFMETSNEHKEKKSDDIRLVIESPKYIIILSCIYFHY